MMKAVKRKKNNILKSVIVFVCIFILVFTGITIYNEYIERKNLIPSVEELKKEKKKNNYQDKDNTIDKTPYVNELPNYRQQYNNADIKGRLEIPGLKIDTLVVRTTNNEYYLNYSLNRKYDTLGVPFFDYRNTDLSNNKQINIYGHNTQEKRLEEFLPMINLEAYLDKNIFDNYKDIYLSIDEKRIKYEAAAVKIVTNSDNEHMKLLFYGDQDYVNHANKLLSNTLYKNDDLKITAQDKLIVLQICHYNPANSYLLIIGKEV